jgi:uncharacterized repeat protein (TIGR02543 family)
VVNGLYDEGTVVGIVATPDSGYQFSGWTVDLGASGNVADTGASSTNVTMDEDMTLTANFAQDIGSLTIKKEVTDDNPAYWSFDFTIDPAVGGVSEFTLNNTNNEKTFNDVVVGIEYTIEEVNTPDGWSVDHESHKITLVANGDSKTVTFTNSFNEETAIQNVLITDPSVELQSLVDDNPNGIFVTMRVSQNLGDYPEKPYFKVTLKDIDSLPDEIERLGWCITKDRNISTGKDYAVILFPADNNNPSIGDKVEKVWGIIDLANNEDPIHHTTMEVQNAIWKATDGFGATGNALTLYNKANKISGTGIIAIPVTSKGMSSTNMFSRDRGIPVDKNK